MAACFHPHARERMGERGVSGNEVRATVEQGEQFPAKFGRTGLRRNLPFGSEWRREHYRTKQVEAYGTREGPDWLVTTRYF